ncbi:MAG: hypothetical protein Q8834_02665, partial [Candidatus Phytoplasma australasiaticum]|nr:hypothetical protein [Candidatus Phytoplasma australasiaticum]
YHYLQLIYAHIGVYYDIQNHQPYQKYNIEQIMMIEDFNQRIIEVQFSAFPELVSPPYFLEGLFSLISIEYSFISLTWDIHGLSWYHLDC